MPKVSEACPFNCHANREMAMVTIDRGVWCDPCIAPLVRALNAAGIKTTASCCGHGHRPGSILLANGRSLIVASEDERGKIDTLFPCDINGQCDALAGEKE